MELDMRPTNRKTRTSGRSVTPETPGPERKPVEGLLIESVTAVPVSEPVEGPLTEQQRNDLFRLEAEFEGGVRHAIEALREIRQRKLYRENFATFDDYIDRRWQKTRQWATQMTNWLRRQELLEAQTGNESYQISETDSRTL